jgi:hypothetical protein
MVNIQSVVNYCTYGTLFGREKLVYRLQYHRMAGCRDGWLDGAFVIITLYIKNSYITEVAWRIYRHQVPSLFYIYKQGVPKKCIHILRKEKTVLKL